MENNIYFKRLEKLLTNTETLDSVEKTSVISIYIMITVYCMIHIFLLIYFLIYNIPEMIFVNSTSIIICILNLLIISDIKKLKIGLTMWVFNSCYFIIAMICVLGYSKNSIIFLPVLLLLIHFIFPKKKKYLFTNTIMVIVTYFISVYAKYNVTAKYSDAFQFIELINSFFALVLASLIIYLKSSIDDLVKTYNLKQLDGLVEEVDVLTAEASVDFLTGLWNRRYTEKQLELEDFTNAYIILADIDFFKRVNDSYGHLCGDYVLKEVANLLKSSFRNIDIVCRWGGEEFLIFMKSPDKTNVINKLERTRKIIQDANFEFNGNIVNITITFGVAQIDKTVSLDKNIEKADIALYYGKNNGRNRVVSYKDTITD